ncbi:MAG TPA: organic solvent ABC transporter ATP-binding protein [Alphaproteobacteria bacterium]|jgi:phospholipid/cholesterol/gamma-HCH transport system ATP-binding protein
MDLRISDAEIPPTLWLADVRLPIPDLQSGELTVDLAIPAGELAVVAVNETQHAQLIADAACGLRPPRQGSVLFQGQDWIGSPPDYANARRGRIGCALDDTAWLSYVPLASNILLPTLYHTRLPRQDVLRDAAQIAQRLGFLGLPMGYPDDYAEADLRRASLVRAFLGKPDLVLVASRLADFAPGNLGRLLNAMRQARDDGAAILWFVPDDAPTGAAALPDCRRYIILDNRLVEEIEQ